MKSVCTLCAAVACAVILAGCTWADARQNLENARALRIGMTKSQVLAVMGEPIRDEIFTRPDVWFYFVEPVWIDGLTTEDECMPLVFKDGKLIGWGNEYYARFRLQPEVSGPGSGNTRELDLGK